MGPAALNHGADGTGDGETVIRRTREWRRRWQGRGRLQRIDLYQRATLETMPWFFLLTWGLAPLAADLRHDPLPWALGGLFTLVCTAQCAYLHRTLLPAHRSYLGRGTFPARGLAVPVVLLAAGLGLLVVLAAVHGIDGDGLTMFALDLPIAFVTPYVLLVPVRSFLLHCLAYAVVSAGLFAAVGVRGGPLAGVAGAGLLSGLLMLLAVRPSAWSLSVMWQAEEARDLQARLAVAEERLRFGRDMHDVLGRNLAVIALKSELAVELARRGKPSAVDQMVEVQRIARASQHEVREVVRGYREADLRAELHGAQAVLRSAGIDCAIEEDRAAADRLPAAAGSALGWVVREATTNVLRHGDPRHCVIRLAADEGSVRLVVENDGTPGPGPAPGPAAGGSGLPGLRERLAALDGSLEAGPAGGGLFRLTATVPVDSLTTCEPEPVAERGAESVPELVPELLEER
ncbi:histidine kinase [Streptomyces sp. NBC_01335]|uniref:sensor histidine kinase n=1 Tax=Streptomyces sp. NBC_01335 TaxID=2903828 RepID=UPI002E154D13|nr:histidine kinase [Streptomyces sp. NBC_01335]